MPITIPDKLQEIFQREFMDMYVFRLTSVVDDMTGFIYDPTKGQIENTFLMTNEMVNGALPYLPASLVENIQEILRIKQEAMDRCFIRETEPDSEQKRYESILSRIATFSGTPKEKQIAIEELTRLGKPVSTDLLKIAYIDEILPVLIGQADPTDIHIDEVAENLKACGLDITPYMQQIDIKAPDKLVYDGVPVAIAKFPLDDINRPNETEAPTEEDTAKIATLDQANGLFLKTFGTQIKNLPDGVNIFDTIYIEGQKFTDHFASTIQGLNNSVSNNILKALFTNEMFYGTHKIEFCPIDKNYNVGEPVRISASKTVFSEDPPRPMGAIRRFFVKLGLFKEYIDRDIRQNKLFDESTRAKTARHAAIKQKLAEKAAVAKQTKDAAVSTEYSELLQKAKAAKLDYTRNIEVHYYQYFKKEDLPILEDANEKMGLHTLNREVSALNFGRIALLAKGYHISAILDPNSLSKEKAAIGRELIEKINTGDQKYFQNMFKEAGLQFKNMEIPTQISTRKDLIKSYSSLKALQLLAIDFQQIKAPPQIANYDADMTPTEKESISKNVEKLGAIAKITSAYTDALIEAEDNPAPMAIINTAVKATIALNLPLQTDIMHKSYALENINLPEGYKSIGDAVTMQLVQMPEDKRSKIITECVAFAKSGKNKSPMFIDGEFMPILKDTHQRITLASAPHTEAPEKTRHLTSIDLSTTKTQNLTPDPKTDIVAPQLETTQPKI